MVTSPCRIVDPAHDLAQAFGMLAEAGDDVGGFVFVVADHCVHRVFPLLVGRLLEGRSDAAG
jgi:hypothetical protein